jgi:hypothetical protein
MTTESPRNLHMHHYDIVNLSLTDAFVPQEGQIIYKAKDLTERNYKLRIVELEQK